MTICPPNRFHFPTPLLISSVILHQITCINEIHPITRNYGTFVLRLQWKLDNFSIEHTCVHPCIINEECPRNFYIVLL